MKKNRTRTIIWGIFFIALLASLIMGYFFLSSSKYFSDCLFILYRDDKNNSNALRVELTRYNLFPYVYHYEYVISLTGEDSRTYSKKYEYDSLDSTFKAADFVKKITNENNENILNENYELSLEIGNRKIDIDLRDMTGDFLVNNSLERFTYVNMGSIKISIDDAQYQADYILNKTASIDHAKLLLDQSVAARGTAIFFSDMSGGLYYVDISHVFEGGSKYMSHAWALNKNGQILKKDVGELVALSSDGEKSFVLNLPAFDNSRVRLNKIANFYSENRFYDLLEGELVNDKGEKRITGFSLNYDDTI